MVDSIEMTVATHSSPACSDPHPLAAQVSATNPGAARCVAASSDRR